MPEIQGYDIPEDSRRQATPTTVRDVTKRVIEERLQTVEEPQELMALRGEGPRAERLIVHELRVKSFDLSETAVIQSMTTIRYEGVLRYNMDHALKELQAEQGNCDWQVVAARLDRLEQVMHEARAYSGPVVSEGDWGAILPHAPGHGARGSVEQRQSRQYVEVVHTRLRVTLVFADLASADVTDPNMVWGAEGREGEMTKYGETRQLRHLPRGLRMQRELAEALLREFYGLLDPDARPAPSIKVQERADPEAAGRRKTTAARLKAQVQAMSAEGLAPAMIAKQLGMEVAQVTELLGEP